jgi:PhzF family phenazine biosynthesis protein
MRRVRVFQVDAFTDTIFAGNPAGVVLDAQQLTTGEMLAIARELGHGDTAFVLPAAGPDEDLRVRFFTPRKEASFVGHATLAVHAVLNASEPLALRRQGGQSGVVQVSRHADGSLAIRLSAPVLGRTLGDDELDAVLMLLDLSRAQLDPLAPPRIAGTASTRLLLGLREPMDLDAARPNLQQLSALSARIGAQGYFLFARRPGKPLVTEARMFCPALGIDEDPVSGNAHAMLGVYLHELGLLHGKSQTEARFVGLQGRHVGRAGAVEVTINSAANGQPTAATISGHAVIVFATEIRLA